MSKTIMTITVNFNISSLFYYFIFILFYFIFIIIAQGTQKNLSFLLGNKYHTTLRKGIVMILIFYHHHYHSTKFPTKTDISYSNQNKPLASIKSERKRNPDCDSPFLPPSPSPPLLFTLFLFPTPPYQLTAEICVDM